MNKSYYSKSSASWSKKNLRTVFRMFGLALFIGGLIGIFYIFFPLISWQIYFGPAFASQTITTPIPRINLINPKNIVSFISQANSAFLGTDYTKANAWFPTFSPKNAGSKKSEISSYSLSIPKINIENAVVSTDDMDLSRHLINYPGTSFPWKFGNAVIFGHSTLPQLFNKTDYKTIFANLYKLKIGDEIQTSVNGVIYKHAIYSITVVDPVNTEALAQTYDNSYLTLVTCTPPGTIWKRLIVKARLNKI